MSKKKKSSNSNGRDNNAPDQINMDDLAVMPDDELAQWAIHCETERTRTWNPTPWEVEIAYVRREQQIRKLRADLHVDFLRRNPVETIDTDLTDEVTQ
jgi:hypothetical protein